MPDPDGRRPRITRTSSLFPGSMRPNRLVASVLRGEQSFPMLGPSTSEIVTRPNSNPAPAARPRPRSDGLTFVPNKSAGMASRNVQDLVPDGYVFVRAESGGILVRRKGSATEAEKKAGAGKSFYQEYLDQAIGDSQSRAAAAAAAPPGTRETTAVNGVVVGGGEASEAQTASIQAAAQTSAVFGPLNLGDIDPNGQFLFDKGSPIAPDTGNRAGQYGVDDSYRFNRHMEANRKAPDKYSNENVMTISAGVLWLRNLAARDKVAYNKLVVLLRNAGYGQLSSNDAELPLNGYSQQAGVAFAYAANDLAQANQGGDDRTLMEYLTERGQSYADYLKQQADDKAAEEAYDPVERRYQDPATLRAAAKAAAVDVLGRKLTDSEEAKFEAAFRARENSFYDQIDKAGEAQTAFSGYAPDMSGQIDAFLDGDQFDTEAAANRIGEYSQVFMRMMGGGG